MNSTVDFQLKSSMYCSCNLVPIDVHTGKKLKRCSLLFLCTFHFVEVKHNARTDSGGETQY